MGSRWPATFANKLTRSVVLKDLWVSSQDGSFRPSAPEIRIILKNVKL